MCVSVRKGVEAQFANTVLYGAEIAGPPLVHVLGYQNKVGNGGQSAPNAMLLPFPAVPASMGPSDVLDTSSCPRVLEDIAKAVMPPPAAFLTRSRSRGAPPTAPVQIFDTGIYTVVLAHSATLIPDALEQVAVDRRPPPNPALFEAYARWYPDWTMALCCFNNAHAALATPMVWKYQPSQPEHLFLPTLDCHTGDVPDLQAGVRPDHTIAVGSNIRPDRICGLWPLPLDTYLPDSQAPITGAVDYKDPIPQSLRPYFLRRVSGRSYRLPMPNGDFYFRVEDLRRGSYAPIRRLPPGA